MFIHQPLAVLNVVQEDPVLLQVAGVGTEEGLVIQRKRIAVGPGVRVIGDRGKLAGKPIEPSAARRLRPIVASDPADRAVWIAVVRRKRRQHAVPRAGNRPRLPEGARIADRIAEEQLIAGPVGILRPQTLPISQIPIHVLPAHEQHTAVGQQLRRCVGQRVHAQALRRAAPRRDAVQVRGRARLADRVAEAARRDEDQVAVRQFAGADVIEWAVGYLSQARPVDADSPQVPMLFALARIRKVNRLGVQRQVHVVDAARGIGEHRAGWIVGPLGLPHANRTAGPGGPRRPDIAADGGRRGQHVPRQEDDRRPLGQ